MNDNGQVFFFTLMLVVVAIFLAIALTPALHESITDARNDTNGATLGLNCTNPDLDNFYKGTCIITDLTLPYWLLIILGLAGASIGARVVFG